MSSMTLGLQLKMIDCFCQLQSWINLTSSLNGTLDFLIEPSLIQIRHSNPHSDLRIGSFVSPIPPSIGHVFEQQPN
ncbi:hypothetical protein VNO77_17266 [Canavalia gladiata]|uniref:Uncharacterized protein n=1 Tax=Canavalia gladiata TaxID=3824 RepID=A0AAN9LIN4_CANGL